MCTNFRISATDGSVVVGRTMEFPSDMGTRITVLPIGYKGAGTGVNAEAGKTWTASQGVVGMDAFGAPGALTDGMNDAGLYAALLYMPGFCDYTPAEGADPTSLLSIVDVVAYLLGTCASTEQVKQAISGITVFRLRPASSCNCARPNGSIDCHRMARGRDGRI